MLSDVTDSHLVDYIALFNTCSLPARADLERDPTKAPWTWFDGTQSEYKNWAFNEPNGEGRENCVEMYYDTGEWNDHFCSSPRGYACKVRKIGQCPKTAYNTLYNSNELRYAELLSSANKHTLHNL